MGLRRNGYRLSPQEAISALQQSGTAYHDAQILGAVHVLARPRVRRMAEARRLGGTPIGGGG